MSCGGIQTQPTCKVEQFGNIVITNRSDEYKQIYYARVIHDGDNYKRIGEYHQRELPPMTEGRLRVHPGMWLVIIDYVEGHRKAFVVTVSLCGTVPFRINDPVAQTHDFEIQNRRFFTNNCDLCECPLFGWFGRYADVLLNHVPRFCVNIP
jgi:hypothetical protein